MADDPLAPRIVFRRPHGVRRAVWVWAGVVCALVLVLLTPQVPDLGRVLAGGMAVALAPLVPYLWLRARHRIELDAGGVTMVGWLGARRYAWTDVAAGRVVFPVSLWNDEEVAVPALAHDTPLVDLDPHDDESELSRIAFVRVGENRFVFDLLGGLCHLRAHDLDGDWSRQVATLFAARARYGFDRATPTTLPAARIFTD